MGNKKDMQMINGKLCYFDYPLVTCWTGDIIKIVSQLIEDGYHVVNWYTFNNPLLQLHYGVDFNCQIWLDTVEDIEMREMESERRANMRKVRF